MENSLPVGWMRPPLPSGTGSVKVLRITPVIAVYWAWAMHMVCMAMRVSGA